MVEYLSAAFPALFRFPVIILIIISRLFRLILGKYDNFGFMTNNKHVFLDS